MHGKKRTKRITRNFFLKKYNSYYIVYIIQNTFHKQYLTYKNILYMYTFYFYLFNLLQSVRVFVILNFTFYFCSLQFTMAFIIEYFETI